MTKEATDSPKRPRCPHCERALAGCICAWVRPIANEVELLILQHPLERFEAKGTAQLLQLSLARSRLLRGEQFDPGLLDGDDRRNLLLYPPTPGETPVPVEPLPPPSGLRLIVLDGTWRKSRKLLQLNPWLQRLPRLSLQDLPASGYAIRKAQRPDQLSTLEAAALALQQLEGRPERYAPLWQAFDGFIAQQQSRRRLGQGRQL